MMPDPHYTAKPPLPLPKLTKCVVTLVFPAEHKTMHVEFADELTARAALASFEMIIDAKSAGLEGREWDVAPRYDEKDATWACNGDDGCLVDA